MSDPDHSCPHVIYHQVSQRKMIICIMVLFRILTQWSDPGSALVFRIFKTLSTKSFRTEKATVAIDQLEGQIPFISLFHEVSLKL